MIGEDGWFLFLPLWNPVPPTEWTTCFVQNAKQNDTFTRIIVRPGKQKEYHPFLWRERRWKRTISCNILALATAAVHGLCVLYYNNNSGVLFKERKFGGERRGVEWGDGCWWWFILLTRPRNTFHEWGVSNDVFSCMPTLVITTSILLGRRVYYHLILWDHSKLIAQTFDLYLYSILWVSWSI